MKYIHNYLEWLYNIIQTIFFRCSVESKCAHIKRIYKRTESNSLEQLRAIVQLLQQRCFICWGGTYGVVGLGAVRLWAICLWGFQYWSMCFVKSDDADVPVRLLKSTLFVIHDLERFQPVLHAKGRQFFMDPTFCDQSVERCPATSSK